jgi:hypothetical protein
MSNIFLKKDSGINELEKLSDVDNTDKAEGKILKVNSEGNHIYVDDESGTDEKVKIDEDDLVAGYLNDKLVAGSGVSITKGTGDGEGTLIVANTGIITESDPIYSGDKANIVFEDDNVSRLTNDTGFITGVEWDEISGTQADINLSGFTDDLSYEVPLTFSTGLTRTDNTITCDITQYEDSDAVSAIKGDADWNASDWDSAYGWGNHADAGYLTEHQSLTDYAKLNDGSQMITSEQHRLVGDIDIVYDGDFVDTVTIGTRVVTFTNDGTSYTKWEDADYEWTPTYTDEKLTKIEVTEK